MAAQALVVLRHERVLGRVELDLEQNERGSVGLRMRGSFDTVPAPRPLLPGLAHESGFAPVAERLDRTTELVFVLPSRDSRRVDGRASRGAAGSRRLSGVR